MATVNSVAIFFVQVPGGRSGFLVVQGSRVQSFCISSLRKSLCEILSLLTKTYKVFGNLIGLMRNP